MIFIFDEYLQNYVDANSIDFSGTAGNVKEKLAQRIKYADIEI